MPKVRILVVDDAAAMRRLIATVLNADAELEVVGTAANGKIALQQIPLVNPDLLTLDIQMPELDGLATLREVRKQYPKLPVIMLSTVTQLGARDTLEALARGATDYVPKPANVANLTEAIQQFKTELVPKIKAHFGARLNGERCATPRPPVILPNGHKIAAVRPVASKTEIVCVGTSTGGPDALAEVFADFPKDFPLPIVIVQHMPPLFTKMLAERLTNHSRLKFIEGEHEQPVEPNHAYIAPGGKHMEVRRQADRVRLHLSDGPPENSCRPAVDVLFRSVASVYGGAALGVILTGMGQDGLSGCHRIRESGGQILAQDEASSVVWGMPGRAVEAGLADRVLPLNQIGAEIQRRVRKGQKSV